MELLLKVESIFSAMTSSALVREPGEFTHQLSREIESHFFCILTR